jgi:hypothetical protein
MNTYYVIVYGGIAAILLGLLFVAARPEEEGMDFIIVLGILIIAVAFIGIIRGK